MSSSPFRASTAFASRRIGKSGKFSELLQTKTNSQPLRWRLFATASSLAFAMTVGQEAQARHPDQARPTVWIELGGQLERIDTDQSPFAPDFMTKTPAPEPFLHASP